MEPPTSAGREPGVSSSAGRADLPERAERRPLVFLLKLLATLALTAWIVAYVDWGSFSDVVREAHIGLIAAVVALRFAGVTISSWKWRELLMIHGVRYSLGRLLRLYLVATFLNHFLPTSIGGDAYRVYKTVGNERGGASAVFAVFMERATGFLALLILGGASAGVIFGRAGDPVAAVVLAVCIAGIVAAALPTLIGPRLSPLAERIAAGRWTKWVGRIPEFAAEVRSQPGAVARVAFLSFLFHGNKLLAMWLVIYALGSAMDPLVLILAVTGVEVVGLVPITLGGLGLMDGSFMYLAANFGLAAEVGLAAMLLHRVLNLPLSFAGAYFYAVGDRVPPDPPPARAGPDTRRFPEGGANR